MKSFGGGKITPLQLLREGKVWLEIWENTSKKTTSLLPATYCLFTALELYLKAYLVLENSEYADVKKLKKLGHNRAEKADTVIFLDFSRRVVYWRVLKRYLGDFKNIIDNFSNTLGIFKYVWKFPRMEILSTLEKYKEGKRILILHNQTEVRSLLKLSS